MFTLQTELFVHSFKDQLVSNALLALYTARPGCANKKLTDTRINTDENDLQGQEPVNPITRQDSIPHHSEYDEEEWVSTPHSSYYIGDEIGDLSPRSTCCVWVIIFFNDKSGLTKSITYWCSFLDQNHFFFLRDSSTLAKSICDFVCRIQMVCFFYWYVCLKCVPLKTPCHI